jgi:glycosyltransferase involved in cell wall biosynthesis
MSTSSPTPIALCITELEFGGAERMFTELATRLNRTRFAPVVYSLGPRPRDDDTLVRQIEAAEIPIEFLDGRGLTSGWRTYRQLRQLWTEAKPRLVQSFLWHANTLSTLAGRAAGVPRLVSGVRVAERRWNLHHAVTRRLESRVDRHVCVSQAVADFMHEKAGIPRDRLVVIPNGVDLQCYPAEPIDLRQLGLDDGRRALVFVGRLDRQKRPDWLLARMPEILARLPGHDLIVVGRGPLRWRLKARAKRLGIANRVYFAGWRSDVPRILAASDLLISTSHSEGMPNVVLEAMASGKPVVATQAEGVAELLAHDRQQVVDGHEAGDFEQKVVSLVGDREQCRLIGQANRRQAEAQFSIESMVRAYEDMYTFLLNESS